jgi:predicted RNA-binding Zn ribbon-like protein
MTTWTEATFVGGHPTLDFVNTAGGRTRARDNERLQRFPDALEWARAAGVLEDAEHKRLLLCAAHDAAEAEQAVVELRAQREALHAFLLAGIENTECTPSARDRVRADILAAYREAELSPQFRAHPAWTIDVGAAGPRVLARRLALATAALLACDQRSQLGVCDRCSWLFLDPSPTRRRRWCSMATCGNRAKAQRHQRR